MAGRHPAAIPRRHVARFFFVFDSVDGSYYLFNVHAAFGPRAKKVPLHVVFEIRRHEKVVYFNPMKL